MRKLKSALGMAALAASIALATVSGMPEALADGDYVRIAGQDRHETMSKIVSTNFTSGYAVKGYAVIVTSDNYPDALSASSLAGILHCPIILTTPDGLSTYAVSELNRLQTRSAYLVGGEGALSGMVEQELTSMGIESFRVAGADRVQTSLSVMAEGIALDNTPTTVIVATGYGFADSLSAGPYAYGTGSPIVLTAPDGTLSDQAVQAILDSGVKEVILVGGDAVVSDAVKAQLGDGVSYERIGGANRYETSARFAEWESTRGFTWARPVFTTGRNYPDALAAAAACGQSWSPLLLADDPADPTVSSLGSHASEVQTCYIIGGTGAVSEAVESQIASVFRVPATTASDLTYVLPHYTITLPEYWRGKVSVEIDLEGDKYPDGQIYDYEQVHVLFNGEKMLLDTGINPGEATHEHATYWDNGVWVGFDAYFWYFEDKDLVTDLITGGQCTGAEDEATITEIAYDWLRDNVVIEWTSSDPMPEHPSWMP